MATLTPYKQLTLAEVAKRTDPDGDSAVIAEVLAQDNDIINDGVWIEANMAFAHRFTKRLSLPTGQFRQLNAGVAASASQTVQVTENLGMLEDYSVVDQKIAEIHPGGVQACRSQEDMAFLQGLGQTFGSTVMYGNDLTEPEKFKGLAPRVATLNGENAWGGSGTGSDLTSIWIIQWGPGMAFYVYPRGSKAGIEKKDLGIQTRVIADTTSGVVSKQFQAYVTHFRLHAGLCVANDRCIQRICNIETSGSSNIFDPDLLIKALNRMPMKGKGAIIYVNETIQSQMDIAAMDKSNVWYAKTDAFGVPLTTFRGFPVRRVDQIINTEDALTA